jgi:phenylalanyl-tRNA synthetase alpha chain
MSYENPRIQDASELLAQRFDELEVKADILKAVELKALYAEIPTLPPEQRASFGKELNQLKSELQAKIAAAQDAQPSTLNSIDVTAPQDINAPQPQLLASEHGTIHPLMAELETVLDIFYRMGFTAVESRELDDEYHMFTSLNFPEHHPARDDYDTFMTQQTDQNGQPLIASAHTSVMQTRILQAGKEDLEHGNPIAAVIPGRVFRNEDLDARHEHTFYQFEGVYVDQGINAGNLIATLKTFLQEYYGRSLEVKTQPFYFPFTEPSFELAVSCPFCQKKGCQVCSRTGWIELLGCGMIHPNVLKMADIEPETYTGFAWGCGLDRLVMLKHDIEDVRHFHSANLNFLRQFA